MSFKDKPLKKIVCDKRVTVDVLHSNKLSEFQVNQSKRDDYIEELEQCQNELLENPSFQLNGKIRDLEEKISKADTTTEVDYFLDTGEILSEYYKQKEGLVEVDSQPKQCILDFMHKKQKEKPSSQTKSLVDDYLSIVDDSFVKITQSEDTDYCPRCQTKMFLNTDEGFIFCEPCGYTKEIVINSEKVSYKDPPRESSYFAYKRINHFNEWLAQFQAKETTDIPEEVYKGILRELDKNPFMKLEDISHKYVREILKRLKFNKYYEHIPHIMNILNGKKAPVLSRKYEEQLRMMFKEIQTPFMKHCPEDRKNFLSYAYVLHKFCELIELDEFLVYFPLLKSREKLQQQDSIWEKICRELQWQYIPSI
jgi:uncharacterized Zn finger protein (UPF0148 family)